MVDLIDKMENVIVNKRLILKELDTGGGKPVVDAGGKGSGITLRAGKSTIEGFIVTLSGIWEHTGRDGFGNYRNFQTPVVFP